MKTSWRPGTMLYPLPAVLVTCGSTPEEYNVFTVAWTGTICSDPAMCYISVRKERHSYDIIKRNMEFVINLTTEELAKATDWCGVRSGKNYDKFKEMNLKITDAQVVKAPILEASPLSIECKVSQIIELGSHDMFIANVVNVIADNKYIDQKTGCFELEKAGLLAYSHGNYYTLGKHIGKFGWTVKKR